jgi:hypothetical protein
VYTPNGDDSFGVNGIYMDDEEMQALREFFLHERDIELGRWRSKKHPSYVVYLHDDDRVRVVRESDGVSYSWNRLSVTLPYGQGCAELQFQPVAREFFTAHPEPKPWHDAKDGEVWALGLGGGYHAESVAVTGGKFVHGVKNAVRVWEITDPGIDYGKRIWPEAKDAD